MHGSDLQKITDLIERHELGKPAMLGSFDNGPSSSGVGVAGGSGSRPSSASSGAVEAECWQDVEAAHPAPARGRWKRNASMKWKPPIQRQSGIRLITAEQHGVH